MSENYFTGEFKNNQSTKSDTKQSANSQQQTSKLQTDSLVKDLSKIDINQQNNDQNDSHLESSQNQSENEQNEIVDAKQITVENEEVDEQKFIQNNPQIAAQQKQLGNQNYSLGQYSDALANYRKSLQYTENSSEQNKKFRSIIYSNIGLTYMKMLQDQNAIQYFLKSLNLNQKYVKARTNLALCYENTQKHQQALQEYKKVLQINPQDNFVCQKIVPLELKVKNLQQKRKQEVISGLKNIGNTVLGYFGMSLDNFKLQQGPGGGYNISFKQ